jgi:hypothetical protein
LRLTNCGALSRNTSCSSFAMMRAEMEAKLAEIKAAETATPEESN